MCSAYILYWQQTSNIIKGIERFLDKIFLLVKGIAIGLLTLITFITAMMLSIRNLTFIVFVCNGTTKNKLRYVYGLI